MRLLRRMGPVYSEFGRFLALRPDLIPANYRDELLESPAPFQPVPWREIQSILRTEFSALDSVFRSVEPASFAYSHLSQIHRGVAADGRRVLIKVPRPLPSRRFVSESRRIVLLTNLLRRTHAAPLSLTGEFSEEWLGCLPGECNAAQEADHLARFADLAASRNDETSFLVVPRYYPDLSTARVIVTEDLDGIPVSELLTPALRSEPRLREREFQPERFAPELLRSVIDQIFRFHFYNADVHPRNLLLLPGNRFSYLSFAHCESVDRSAANIQRHFLSSIFRAELPAVFRTLEELLEPTHAADADGMRSAFVGESHQWLRGGPASGTTRGKRAHGSPMSHWLMAIVQEARAHRYRIPLETLSCFRTLVTAEWVAGRLDAKVSLQVAGLEFLADIQLDESLRILEPEAQHAAISDLLTLIHGAPARLRQILSDSVQSRLALNLNAAEHPHSAGLRDRRARMITAALGAVGVAWIMGEPGFPRAAGAGALGLLTLYVAFQWRRLER